MGELALEAGLFLLQIGRDVGRAGVGRGIGELGLDLAASLVEVGQCLFGPLDAALEMAALGLLRGNRSGSNTSGSNSSGGDSSGSNNSSSGSGSG